LERDIDEECEPKYAAEATCDAETCKRLPLCGDGEIDTDVGEQCDPSNGADCIDCKFSLDAGDADAAISSPSCSSDLANVSVANGHFDVDISSWLLPNGTVTAAHQGVGADDPGSILVTYAAGSLPNASVNGVEQCVSIELGITYTLVARYSNPATNSEGVLPGISVKLYSGATCSGSFVSGSGPPVSNAEDTWVAFSRSIDTSIVAPSGSGAMLIQLGAIVPANTASGQMRYDGIALGSCGNCLIEQEAGEGCDDGNTVAGDGCSPTCQLECGNGTLQTPEQCDDGNLTFGDLCSPSCRTKTGCDSCVTTSCNPAVDTCLALDGVAQAGPARGRPRNALCSELRDCIHDSGCNLNTAIANGPTVAGEPVDPANPGVPENCYCGSSGVTCLESDAANGSCRAQIEAALETTDPNLILGRVGGAQPEFPVFDAIAELLNCEASSCAADCVKPITCGNGYVENRTQAFVSGFSFLIDRVPTPCDDQYTHSGSGCSFEECDDGNTNNGDGCDENCFLEACGNYLKQGIEECDDGNVLDEDGCHSDCTAEFICGDEIVDDRFEDCEPPNTGSVCSADEHDTDPASCGCDDHCLYKVCGNEIVQEGEECDPPNGASCDENCQRSVDDCTECMLRLDANQPCTQDLFNGNGIPNDPFGLGCLQDPLCLDLWDCERESLCFLEGLAACYCGPGADFSACERSTYVLTGECKDEMLAAFEEQWGRPPNNNIEMMDNFFQVPPAPSRGPLVNASYIVDTCLVPDGAFVTTLREQLTASGLSSQDVDTCMNACFP
jgi:cysteine-rich repeat protein